MVNATHKIAYKQYLAERPVKVAVVAAGEGF